MYSSESSFKGINMRELLVRERVKDQERPKRVWMENWFTENLYSKQWRKSL